MFNKTEGFFSPLASLSGDGWTDVGTKCAKTMIPTGRDFGLAHCINYEVLNIPHPIASMTLRLLSSSNVFASSRWR